MDPLTQGILGATLPQSMTTNAQVRNAGLMGFFAGMFADIDVLIQSNSDPLLFLEYHRQFTHSLVFIPVGGLICALLMYAMLAKNKAIPLLQCWVFCTLGFATHALLDACTSYGTQLFWPFSPQRVAWDIISIVDPLYTLPLLLLLVLTLLKRNKRFAVLALCWSLAYPAMGYLQRQRAEQAGWQWAQQQQHKVLRLTAKPSFANLLLWKVIVETDSHFYTFAIRAGLQLLHYPGETIRKLELSRDLPWLDKTSQQARDILRFSHFSNGYIALDPNHDQRIIDIRYSLLPNSINALWGIQLSPHAADKQHVRYYTNRDLTDSQLQLFKQMLFNTPEPTP